MNDEQRPRANTDTGPLQRLSEDEIGGVADGKNVKVPCDKLGSPAQSDVAIGGGLSCVPTARSEVERLHRKLMTATSWKSPDSGWSSLARTMVCDNGGEFVNAGTRALISQLRDQSAAVRRLRGNRAEQ